MVKKGSHLSSGGPGRPKSKLICQSYCLRRVTEKGKRYRWIRSFSRMIESNGSIEIG